MKDEFEIDIDSYKTITVDSADIWNSSLSASSITGPYFNHNVGAVGATGAAGSYYTNNTWSGTFSNGPLTNTGLTCSGDANFEGDVKIKGVSIAETLEAINQRLAILVPDPAKLEHFAALKKAYDHYKVLEALCELPTETKE